MCFSLGDALGMWHEGLGEMDTAVDRVAPVCSVALKREFPPVGAFDDLNVDDETRDAIGLWVDP